MIELTLDLVYCSGDLTLYVVYVWGDRCGREVAHFDSRPVSIVETRVGITPPFRSSAGR
jgi:hypothetical protein